MTKEQALERLKAYEMSAFALSHAKGILHWDAATYAPKNSARVRPNTVTELSRMTYELTTSPEASEMLEVLMKYKDELDPITARKVSEQYKNYERTKKVPKDEFSAFQMLLSESSAVWHQAKEENNFAMFEPYLQRVFDAKKKIAGYYDSTKDPYDVCLDICERGLTCEKCDDFFDRIKSAVVPLIKEINEKGKKIDKSILKKPYSIEKQKELSDFIVDYMCIDKNSFNVSETEHPFTTGFTKNDVRITVHYHEDDLMSVVYSHFHEGGHGLYALHTGDELMYTCLDGGASMAMHESQSRFYENMVGRSEECSKILLKKLKEIFPAEFNGISDREFYEMANATKPSLIRLDADELTYSLHIMIRYEIEKLMFDGKITAKDIPEVWNKLYKDYLGIDVPNDKKGCLQDSHWSDGLIGYFPSYALGSAYAAQYMREMNKSFDAKKAIANSEVYKINNWLEEKIWRYGKMYDPVELFEMVCGKFEPQYFIDYLIGKFKNIYNI